jgi:hypothetical protein
MLHIYASVFGVIIRVLQVFHRDVCNGYTRVFKFFLVFLQVFQLFRTYVTSVSSGYCKSRSGVAHVAMRVRSEGGASDPCAPSGGTGDVRLVQACVGARNAGLGGGVLE